jgi:hypothetical protein
MHIYMKTFLFFKPTLKLQISTTPVKNRFVRSLRKTEEQQQYKTPLNLAYLLSQISSGVDIS